MNKFIFVITSFNLILLFYNSVYQQRVPYFFKWHYKKDDRVYYYTVISFFTLSNLFCFIGALIGLASEISNKSFFLHLNHFLIKIIKISPIIEAIFIACSSIALLSFIFVFLIYIFDKIVIDSIVNLILRLQKYLDK